MTADTVGGVWTYALDLGRKLAAAKVQVTLATLGPDPDKDKSNEASAAGIMLKTLGGALDWTADHSDQIVMSAARLLKLSKRLRPDLVHLNSPALAAFVSFDAPLLVGCHSCLRTWWQVMMGAASLPDDCAWRTAVVARGYANADALVAPSRAFADATQRAYGLPATPTAILNGRIGAPEVWRATQERPTALKQRYKRHWMSKPGCGSSQPRLAESYDILCAGRLWDAAKDVATLDRAIGHVGLSAAAAGPLVGPNGEAVAFEHLRSLGRLPEPELRSYFDKRPIFVASSRYEPFGLAVLEAAQSGCPLVLSDIPTFRELWDGSAIFFPPGNDVVLADTLGRLASDPVARLRWGDAARGRSSHYSATKMARETLNLYATLNPAFALDAAA